MRWWWIGLRAVLLLAAMTVALVGGAGPASAHPTLLATSPPAGYAVTTPPQRVVLEFDEPVTPQFVRVVVDGDAPIDITTVTSEQNGRQVQVGLAGTPAAGRYVVRWRVTAQDGDVVDGAFDFAVGTGAAELSGHADEQTPGLPVVVALRWLLFGALAVALGGMAAQRLVRITSPVAPQPRPVVRKASAVGALAGAGLLVHLVVAGGGSGRAVPLLTLEIVGFVVALATRTWVAVAGLAVVVMAEGWRNHLGVQDGAAGAMLVAVHLGAVAVWAGALLHVLRTAHGWGWRGPAVLRLVSAYGRAALAIFLAVVLTGTAGALLLLPSPQALVDTAYGRALLAKLALVAVVATLAMLARRRLHRDTEAPLGRAAPSEAITVTAVLAVTALLVSLPVPAPPTQDLAAPLPATGPVVRLGMLAGHVSVGVAASENQVELRLRVPDDAAQLGEAPPPAYRVAAAVARPGQPPTPVRLRGCGPGCFVGPAALRAGNNQVDVQVEAQGWHGGTATLTVAWPPRVDSAIVDRVVAVMRAQQAFTITETVTSDTSRPDPPAATIRIDGPTFLDSQPYGDAVGLEAIVETSSQGRTVVTFGLPAEGMHVWLELDDTSRIVREILAAPKHLSELRFRYDQDP